MVELAYWLGLAVMHVKGTTQDLPSAQVFLTLSNISTALAKESIDYGLNAIICGLGIIIVGILCILTCILIADSVRYGAWYFCKVANSKEKPEVAD